LKIKRLHYSKRFFILFWYLADDTGYNFLIEWIPGLQASCY